MEKRTPMPWKNRESATHITVIGANNETLFHDDKRLPLVVGDALLIAVAPELLEALKDAHPHVADDSLRARIGNLIAKAEGA